MRPPGGDRLSIVLVRNVRVAQQPEALGSLRRLSVTCSLALSALSGSDESQRSRWDVFWGANPKGENLRGGKESVPKEANSASRVDGDN